MINENNNNLFELTDEQTLSLRTDRHISVTANAGSGKTFVLVKRYQDIIKKTFSATPDIRIDPSRIVAITFTRKAAGEMHKKVIKAFDDELAQLQKSGKNSFQQYEQLKRIREGLSYASITTIHSFCSNLLRQFPIEAGVSVNFSEISESENMRLRSSAVINNLEDWLLLDQNNRKQNAELLLSQFSRKILIENVTSILNKVELFDKFKLLYSKTDQEIFDSIDDLIHDNYRLQEILMNIKEMFSILLKHNLFHSPKSKTNGHTEFYDKENEFKKLDSKIAEVTVSISDCQEIIQSFVDLLNGKYTLQNKLYKSIAKLINDDDDRIFLESQNEFVAEIKKILIVLESRKNLETFLKISRIIWEFTQEVKSTVDEEKDDLNALDFDDLQIKVLELLDNPKVVEKIVSQIDYIMIDEFQDTNELQYNIVRKLMPELFENNTKVGINLFVVGDAKQSIYGFRNADVRVFNKVVIDILSKNTILRQSNSINDTKILKPERIIDTEEQLGKNRLSSTFRLRPEIAAFVNFVCSKIMEANLSVYEVEYTPLVCSKDTENIEINNGEIVKSGNLGKVVFLVSQNDNNDQDVIDAFSENNDNNNNNDSRSSQIFRIDPTTDGSDRPEENMIANYIKSIVGTKLEGRENAIQYKDIAILSRRRTKFSAISSELLSQNIPFWIHSGKGFFNTEEIADFMNFLKFIYNPDDDIAFISVLRSPFFNIDDQDILILKKNSRNSSVWQNLKKSTATEERTANALEILKEILAVSSTTSISKVILLIMEKTGWSGLIAGKPARHQILANIDKFIEIARSYENVGFKNIYDFVEELKFISEHEIGESEAAILTNENAVNIMTIHASKGLQFPVVILYDSNSGVGGSSTINISEELGIGFKISIPSQGIFENKVDNILNIINKDIKKKSEQAEAKRVLYVAMTRAEEILVISSHAKLNRSGFGNPKGQLDLILTGLDLSIDDLYSGEKIIRNTSLDIRKEKKIITADYKMCIEVIKYPFIALSNSVLEQPSISVPTFLLNNISSTQNSEYFSPSKLMSFKQDEIKYFNNYILGLNYQDISEPENYDHNDQAAGKIIGLEIHRVLESITEWLNGSLSVDDNLLKQKIAIATSSSTFNEGNITHSRIYDECVNVAMTELIQREYNFIKQGKTEFQLSIPFGENILFGIIDLYFKASNGEFEIWDWKSNQIESIEEKDKLAASYESQMLIYAYLISKLHPDIQTLKARLLFTRLAQKDISGTEWTHTFYWNKEALEACKGDIENNIMQIRDKLYLWLD